MKTIHTILYSILAFSLALLSYLTLQKSRKIEDLYDDVLDAKADLKLKNAEIKLVVKRKDYESAVKEYAKVLKDTSTPLVLFTIDTKDSKSGGTDQGSNGSNEVPPSSDKLH